MLKRENDNKLKWERRQKEADKERKKRANELNFSYLEHKKKVVDFSKQLDRKAVQEYHKHV